MSVTDLLTPANAIAILRSQVEKAGGIAAFARGAGIPPSVVSETLSGRRDISEAVANAAGLVRVVRFLEINRRTA